MISFSIGLPGRFTEWCDSVAAYLAGTVQGHGQLIAGNTLEEIGLAVVRLETRHLVVGARQPAEGVRAAVEATQTPFIVALDDPRAALRNLIEHHGMDWKAATRATANSCAAVLGFIETPGALVMHADREGRDPLGAAVAIARHLGFEVDSDESMTAAKAAAGLHEEITRSEIEPWWDALDPAERLTAGGTLSGYIDHFSGRGLGEIIWRSDLFFLGDEPQQAVNGAIGLTGQIRCLLVGPYIALPPGEWTATVTVAVSSDGAGVRLRFEVFAGYIHRLCTTDVDQDGQGICRALLGFNVDRTTVQPFEVRVINLQPAFAGRFVLGNVVLSRRVHRTENPNDLLAHLDR